MRKKTRSILEELNNIHLSRDKNYLIETTANNIIESAINFISNIRENYDPETAADLEKRFINSIRTADAKKFNRKIRLMIEGKHE